MQVIRGFVAGVAWGGVVAGLGLAVISQVAPRSAPPQVEVAGTSVAPAADAGGAKVAGPPSEGVATEGVATEGVATEGVIEPAPQADAPKIVVESVPPVPPAEAGNPARPAIPALTPPGPPSPIANAGTGGKIAPEPGPATAPVVDAAAPPALPEEVLLAPPPDPEAVPDAAPAPVTLDQLPVPEAGLLPRAVQPAPDAAPDLPIAKPLPAPVPDAAPDAASLPEMAQAEPEPPLARTPDSAPGDPVLQPVQPIIAADATRTLAPDPGLPGTDGVRIATLPRIGDVADADAAATPAPEDAPPVQRFARVFDNPDGKPLMGVLLRDTGAADLDRAALAQISFPVTFVVDPMLPGAAEAARVYRDAGQEVLTLASGIPAGATPGDLEQMFQSLASILPEAVGVMDEPEDGFRGNRSLATQVVQILRAQGRGLVTFDAGLNAADQEARRAALPSTMIFRQLDADGEEAPVIRRYLDRAAFKAAQEGRVVVLGETRPETVAALLEWAVEGRAASVALAPVTAVMGTP